VEQEQISIITPSVAAAIPRGLIPALNVLEVLSPFRFPFMETLLLIISLLRLTETPKPNHPKAETSPPKLIEELAVSKLKFAIPRFNILASPIVLDVL